MHRFNHGFESRLIVAEEARLLVIIAIDDAHQVITFIHLAAKKVRLMAESVDSPAFLKLASLWVSSG